MNLVPLRTLILYSFLIKHVSAFVSSIANGSYNDYLDSYRREYSLSFSETKQGEFAYGTTEKQSDHL